MNNHATRWLGAYVDGELEGLRLRRVEAHLKECSECQGELQALTQLRGLLQESPAMEVIIPPERFVAQVGLRLPRRQEQPPTRRAFELGWRLVPVGLLFVLVFVQAVFIVAGVVQVALWLGVGGDFAAYLSSSATGGPLLPDVSGLSQANLADAAWMVWGLVQTGGGLALLPALYLCLVGAVGLLYWSWLASWWARRRRRELPASRETV